MDDKVKGKAKEAFGALTGDEAKKEEGRALQRKAKAQEEAVQRSKTRQAQGEARQAEIKRDRQKQKDEGLLGGVTDYLGDVTDSLSGRDRSDRGSGSGPRGRLVGPSTKAHPRESIPDAPSCLIQRG